MYGLAVFVRAPTRRPLLERDRGRDGLAPVCTGRAYARRTTFSTRTSQALLTWPGKSVKLLAKITLPNSLSPLLSSISSPRKLFENCTCSEALGIISNRLTAPAHDRIGRGIRRSESFLVLWFVFLFSLFFLEEEYSRIIVDRFFALDFIALKNFGNFSISFKRFYFAYVSVLYFEMEIYRNCNFWDLSIRVRSTRIISLFPRLRRIRRKRRQVWHKFDSAKDTVSPFSNRIASLLQRHFSATTNKNHTWHGSDKVNRIDDINQFHRRLHAARVTNSTFSLDILFFSVTNFFENVIEYFHIGRTHAVVVSIVFLDTSVKRVERRQNA